MFKLRKILNLIFVFTLVALLTHAEACETSSTLYQAGLLLNLNNGVFAGSIPLSALLKKGNFGLGASDGAPGELIILDGKPYLGDAAGVPRLLSGNTNATFVQVTNFKPTQTMTLNNIHSLEELGKTIDTLLPSKNIFYALKIEGTFKVIKLRNFSKPVNTKIPLYAWLKQYQVISYPKNIRGTMVAFRSPNYAHTIAVSGYHLHFISYNHDLLGHVYDLAFDHAKVSIEPLFYFSLALPDSPDFLKASLDETQA